MLGNHLKSYFVHALKKVTISDPKASGGLGAIPDMLQMLNITTCTYPKQNALRLDKWYLLRAFPNRYHAHSHMLLDLVSTPYSEIKSRTQTSISPVTRRIFASLSSQVLQLKNRFQFS